MLFFPVSFFARIRARIKRIIDQWCVCVGVLKTTARPPSDHSATLFTDALLPSVVDLSLLARDICVMSVRAILIKLYTINTAIWPEKEKLCIIKRVCYRRRYTYV